MTVIATCRLRKMAGGLAAWLLLAVSTALAQSVTMDIQPRVMRLNESATLKLSFINLNPPQAPALPDIPGFRIQYSGQENHYQISNGAQEHRVTFNYRLQPQSTGKFDIGPFAMGLDGQNIEIAAVPVEVLPATASAGGNNASGATESIDDLIFARIRLPRTDVYLQERFDIELQLYYRNLQLDRGIQLQNLPGTGLNLENFEEIGSTRENVNNQLYEVRRFRMRGTALTAGTFEIAPMVRVNVVVPRERSRDPFFGGFDAFFGVQETRPLSVPAEAMNVVIRPLPSEGKPDNFSGAVGSFNMDMSVEPQEITAGDPVTLTLRITGRGNFESISMPAISLGGDFRSYDPKLVASGPDNKTFEQVFIPKTDAVKEIPPVSFTYFDPDAKSYKTVVRGPIALAVKAGASSAPQVVQSPASGRSGDHEPLGIDIIDLKRSAPDWRLHALPGFSPIAVAGHAAPALALLALFAFQKRRENIDRDVTRRRRTLAPKSARRSIRRAEEALTRKEFAVFHEAIWQSMADYIAHRANLEPGQVSPGLILARLEKGGLAPEKLNDLKRILSAGEEARFARSLAGEDEKALQEQLQTMQEILKACERIRV